MKVFCNSCKRITNQEVLKSIETRIDDDDAQITFVDTYEIIKCLGCEEISFRHDSTNSDAYDPETGEHYENVRLYPIRSDKTLPLKPYYNVPAIVRNIYRETIDAFNNELNLLCAAGLRAIIESICNNEMVIDGPVIRTSKDGTNKVVRAKDLMGKINGLHEKGVITKKQVDILHEHRYLGNEALHALDTPHKSVLQIAIEIIENVLDLLYEIDQKAGQLTWRRQMREKKKKP